MHVFNMVRICELTFATVGTSVEQSTLIDLDNKAGAVLLIGKDSELESVEIHVAATPGGEYLPLADGVVDVQPGTAIPLPNHIHAAPYIKLVGNVEGTVTVSAKS